MAEQSAHLLDLAETIGPRPAATDEESRAADYVEAKLAARGLEVDRQEFQAPRSVAWAYVIYGVLTILVAVGSRWVPWWAAVVVGLVVAFLQKRDLDTRGGLSTFLPKAPSLNLIGRHVPKARRGEKLRPVVLVAHYDSPKTAVQLVTRRFELVSGIRKAATWLVPLLVALAALPFARRFGLVPWYVTLVPAALLLLPLLTDVYEAVLARPTPGANDNASGVAALLGVMELLVPEPDAAVYETSSLPRIEVTRRTEEDAWAADVVPEDSLLSYAPAATPRRPFEEGDLDDLGWGEASTPSKGQTTMPLEDEDKDEAAWQSFASSAPQREAPPAGRPEKKRRLLGRKQQEAAPAKKEDVRDWLGVDEGFDAKEEGRKIGSWDRFGNGDDDDDIGWKGGSAGADGIDDPDFAADEAARIRRKVMSTPDRSLVEKEIWFVATGCGSVGGEGMKALLAEHGTDLRDALFINIQAIGSGTPAWVTVEGAGKRIHADRRLTGTSRRVATDNDLQMRGKEYRGPVTDTTVALARRHKAMSVMAFDINGRQPGVRTMADTPAGVSTENIETVVDFVAKLIAEL